MDLTSIFTPRHRRLIKFTSPVQGDQALLLEHFSAGDLSGW
ncbi:hypothetical protein N8H41_24035 [Pseudomonas vlassakiae]|nr:hypothetical protein [Pseudomonas vlassakiae]MCU0127052.1 hypothetical protein [Pseudomonas vlassakiae]